MPYLLDGNNLIGMERRSKRPSAEDRAALRAEVAERLRRTRARAVLFFDGAGERDVDLGGLAIRSSGSRSADDAIVEEVRRSRAPRECTVVTADRALIGRVRDLGARTLAPEEFWNRLGSGPSRSRVDKEKDERVDVADWLRYFEDEKNREE